MVCVSKYAELAGMLFPSEQAREAAEAMIDTQRVKEQKEAEQQKDAKPKSRLLEKAYRRAQQLEKEADERSRLLANGELPPTMRDPDEDSEDLQPAIEPELAENGSEAELEDSFDVDDLEDNRRRLEEMDLLPVRRRSTIAGDELLKQRQQRMAEEDHKALLRTIKMKIEDGSCLVLGRNLAGDYRVQDAGTKEVFLIDQSSATIRPE
eukprot:TRINITY_DN1803_c0_g1_i2.p1 TRINITY_DN1803_c0_g1~~TRINITY_DN1803_c0_g1_i2.p1  ORF type:complete len:208 (+),score=52.18 TRINITY_DN1803_c0_g1_i2:71-694(+)